MSQENTTSKQPLIRYVNRQQMSWRAVDVDKLIAEDHRARAIWTLVGRLDLSPFYRAIESSTEEGGRPAFDPQLLISLWVYAYSQGIGSAREVARRCAYDPAFQWLTGWEEVNYHTLADFRVEKQQELDELFTQVLAALSQEGLITLEQVMQDGTKIKAQASSRSYCQEETIREHLERARRRVAEMGDPRNEESSPKAKQAQVRARRQQQERLESALEELQKWQARKSGEKAKKQTRVSSSDPQARAMHQPDGGLALSYNAQISTDAAQGLIVGVVVTQELDLEKFFDRVNHDKLMGQVAKRVEDKRLLKLIRAFLNAGVMENGLVSPSVEGTPQGGPLSPLLSNLVLDELDRELERRGHRYVRYADDCNIYVRSERAGQRVMKSITKFITQQLKLKVNESKSAVARPQERKFLGFSFTDGPEVQRVIAPKALDRFKRRVREITRRAKGVSIEMTMAELAPYMRGWRSYFGFCETPQELVNLTRWVRLRLRVALWRQWKTPRRRRAALLELGVRPRLARNTASSSRGPRYLAQAKALSVGLSNAYFKSLGLPSLIEGC